LQFTKSNYVSFASTNGIRQGETPQSERLGRERLGLIDLEFRLPNGIMEYVLPFPNFGL